MIKNLSVLFLISTSFTVFAQSTLLHNVNGYSMVNGKLTQFSAIKFTNDTIDAVYKSSDTLPNELITIDGKGNTLLPGLIDAHGHVLNYGLSLQWADLVGSSSESDAVNRVRLFNKNNKTSPWLFGRGWNQVLWATNTFPTAKSLDKLFPEQAVLLGRIDGHAIWVNSKAMSLAGIDKDTISPEGGEIIKDEHGNPTGIFVDNAMELIHTAIPNMTLTDQKSALITAMQSLASYGLTSVHDAGITTENIALYKELAKNNNMAIRVNGMLSVEDKSWKNILNEGVFKSDNDLFKLDSVKISADGALGSRGAALIADYSDLPHHKGLLLYNTSELDTLIETAMQAGFQVNTHAIGDNANYLVLNHYQKWIDKTQSKNRRHRIEHAQVLQLEDISRFAELNIIPSMQATHATSDKNMAEDRLGKDRLRGAYAWRKLLDAGSKIANGSDFPVESPNPFYGLHAAITRQDHQNQPLDGWISSEKMTTTEAFASFTIDAAYAGHQENIIGSIEVGKKADFILIEQDLFNQEPSTIWKNNVLETWVNGIKVYQKN